MDSPFKRPSPLFEHCSAAAEFGSAAAAAAAEWKSFVLLLVSELFDYSVRWEDGSSGHRLF